MSAHPVAVVEQIKSIEQFKEILTNNPNRLIVVDFGAPWCGPCRQIAPFFHDLAARHQQVATFLYVDADELPDLASGCQVQAFPTFLFFKNSVVLGQVQGANREQLTAYVQKFTASHTLLPQLQSGVVNEIEDDIDFDNQISAAQSKLVVVDFFTTWCGPCRQVAPVLTRLAAENPDVLFLKVNGENCYETARQYSISGWPTFLFFKDGLNCGRVRGANVPELTQTIQRLKIIPPGEILQFYQSTLDSEQ